MGSQAYDAAGASVRSPHTTGEAMSGNVSLVDVQAVYNGAEGDLWELIMGQQIHIGGLRASQDLAARAGIAAGRVGVDLCCCNGAGMRYLVRFHEVARMTGVDATAQVIARGKERCVAEGLAARVRFVQADVCASGLADACADFVWGEDAWCYVLDKARLINEAARLVKPGGVNAFTDWMAGEVAMNDEERARFLGFMKFPNVESLAGYCTLLAKAGCVVEDAADTARFAEYVDLYLAMVDRQLTYDALRLLEFDTAALAALAAEMVFMRDLARAGKIIQGRLLARRPR